MLFHDRTGGAALDSFTDKLVAVEIFAVQRHEKIARPRRARIGAQGTDQARAVAVLPDGAGKLRDLIDRVRVHLLSGSTPASTRGWGSGGVGAAPARPLLERL